MSLSVDVFVIGSDGKLIILDVPPDCSDLAGFERWRTTVWGSEPVRSLGARFLPQLATEDLYVYPGDVQDFLDECGLVLGNLPRIAARLEPSKSFEWYMDAIPARLANIIDAARRAQRIGGGVLIW